MPDLSFRVASAAPVTYAASPLLELDVRVANAGDEPIHSIALRCQIQIEARRRHYSGPEQAALCELFGQPERWSQTLSSMLWTIAGAVVQPFSGSTAVKVAVPCTFDFNVAATKYFYGLQSGEIPLTLLFSGTIFYEGESGALQVAQIPWDREAGFALPLEVWQAMMDHYYPNGAWLCLQRDIFDRLYRYKVRHGLTSWEAALGRLLDDVEACEAGALPATSETLASIASASLASASMAPVREVTIS
jgi:hypothetical protein